MASNRIITRDFVIAMTILMCSSMNFFLILINLQDFVRDSFGGSTTDAGIAAGLYVFGGITSRILFGKYIELFGRKRMLNIALLCAATASMLYFVVASVPQLFVLRFVHGMTYGIASACSTDIVSKIIPPERRGEGLSYYFIGATVSTAIGPFLGLELTAEGGYDTLFAVGAGMYILAFVMSLIIRVPEEKLTDEQKHDARSFSFGNLVQVPALPISAVCMVFFFAYSSIHTFIAAYSESIDLVVMAGSFYIASAFGSLTSRITTGRIYDTKGPNGIITVGFVCFAAGMLLFSRTSSLPLFLVSGFMIGYGMSLVFAVCQTIAISTSDAHRYGVTVSTFNGLTDFGTGIGPMILGAALAFLSYRDMYMMCASIAVISLAMYWVAHGFKAAKRD